MDHSAPLGRGRRAGPAPAGRAGNGGKAGFSRRNVSRETIIGAALWTICRGRLPYLRTTERRRAAPPRIMEDHAPRGVAAARTCRWDWRNDAVIARSAQRDEAISLRDGRNACGRLLRLLAMTSAWSASSTYPS